MSAPLQPKQAAAVWPRLREYLLVLGEAISTTTEDISDRRITRLETELAAIRNEVTFLRAQGPRGGSVSGPGEARD